MKKIRILNWGLIPYEIAVARQKRLVRDVIADGADTLIFCEHPRTITLGRTFTPESLLTPREELVRLGFVVAPSDRGGDVTLHAPGQLVLYPIINLKRAGIELKEYLRKLEEVAIDFLRGFGIVATGDDNRRGVWVGARKIASIGIGVSRWVTYHGMAVNVSNDLLDFQVMKPCGLDVRMTSLKAEWGHAPDMADIYRRMGKSFLRIYG
ncbi:MAG: lipoyl(octanoyl) transferase LipB [Candidatus Omnitrophica bacterium]|nr:lipoyl(octanoyl) transferase LipB [Candidatus Omnitrophota bacterium]